MTPQERAEAAYKLIAKRARRHGFTPSYTEMARTIQNDGTVPRGDQVTRALSLLEAQGRIIREGARSYRSYRLPGTNFVTRPKPHTERFAASPFSTKGWPRPSKKWSAIYDKAMAARPFAAPEHMSGERPDPHPIYVRNPRRTPIYSECGCAAAECAL